MKVSFHIADKEFPDYLQITACGKSQCFNDKIILENDSCNNLSIEIERISTNKFVIEKIKNPFLRFLVFIPIVIAEFLISALVFFIDADNYFGINADAVFSKFCPFKIKKTFYIAAPDNKDIGIQITDSTYNKSSKVYSLPDICLDDESAICAASDITYSEKILKQQFCLYTVPAFCILWIVTMLLNILSVVIFTKIIREFPLNNISFNIGATVGAAFCCLIVSALFIAVTVIFIRLYQTCKKITEKMI